MGLGKDGLGDEDNVRGLVFYCVDARGLKYGEGVVGYFKGWGVPRWDCGNVEEGEGLVPRVGLLGWIVGRIVVDGRGELWIEEVRRNGRVSGKVRVVVAPGLLPDFNGAVVVFKLWRFIGGRDEGVVEVWLRDIVKVDVKGDGSVFKGVEYMTLRRFVDEGVPRGLREFNVRGLVRSKSAVLAKRSSQPNFLLELCDPAVNNERETVTLIVFDGEAVQWWPFLHVGKYYGISALRFATLPSLRNIRILRAGSKTFVTSVNKESSSTEQAIVCKLTSETPARGLSMNSRDSQVSTTVKIVSSRPRMTEKEIVVLKSTKVVKKRSNGRSRKRLMLITYSGKVSEVLADGKVKLDGSILVHIGAYGGWCGGARVNGISMRFGARIRLANISIAYRWGKVRALTPTARTSIEIIEFGGPCRISDMGNDLMEWRTSPWRFYWKELGANEVIWAEELFEGLSKKFGPFLQRESTSQEPTAANPKSQRLRSDPLVEMFLGTNSTKGLVRLLMKSEGVLGTPQTKGPTIVYRDFVESKRSGTKQICDGSFPYMPTIEEVSRACDSIWKARHSEPLVPNLGQGENHAGGERLWDHKVCNVEQIWMGLEAHKKHKLPRSDLLLIGMLEPTETANGFRLVDHSGVLSLALLGKCAPEYAHAMVKVRDFRIVIERTLKGGIEKSLIVAASNLSILVIGPYSKAYSPLVHKSSYHQSAHTHNMLSPQFSQVANMTQTVKRDVPVICFFVLKKSPPVLYEGSEVKIDGFLVAIRQGGRDEYWTSIFNAKGHVRGCTCRRTRKNGASAFYKSTLILSGKEAVLLRPLVYPGCLYAITCSSLDTVTDFRSYFEREAGRSGHLSIRVDDSFWLQEMYEHSMMFYDEPASNYSDNKGVGRCKCLRQKSDWKEHYRASENNGGGSRGYSSKDSSRSSRWIESLVVEQLGRIRQAALFVKPIEDVIKHKEAIVSFTATIISRDISVHGYFGNTEYGWTLRVCDPRRLLRVFKIYAKSGSVVPCTALPGATISVTGALCRISQSGKVYVDFGSCSTLRVESLPVKETKSSAITSFRCCQRPLEPLHRLMEFNPRGTLSLARSKGTVTMRYLTIVRVLKIRFEKKETATCTTCSYCGNDSPPWYIIDPYIECQIDDGSAGGCLIATSFRVAMETLFATAAQVNKIKQYVYQKGSIRLQSSDLNALDNDFAAMQSAGSDEIKTMFRDIANRARRPVTVFVTPRINTKDSQGETFVTTSVPLGLGRRMCTAISNEEFCRYDCYAVVEDADVVANKNMSCDEVSGGVLGAREATEQLLSMASTMYP